MVSSSSCAKTQGKLLKLLNSITCRTSILLDNLRLPLLLPIICYVVTKEFYLRELKWVMRPSLSSLNGKLVKQLKKSLEVLVIGVITIKLTLPKSKFYSSSNPRSNKLKKKVTRIIWLFRAKLRQGRVAWAQPASHPQTEAKSHLLKEKWAQSQVQAERSENSIRIIISTNIGSNYFNIIRIFHSYLVN